MQVRSLGWEDPLEWEDALEEGMATHSSPLAWRIPWTEEPGGLQCIASDPTERPAPTHRAPEAFEVKGLRNG